MIAIGCNSPLVPISPSAGGFADKALCKMRTTANERAAWSSLNHVLAFHE
jgi:hypothetical protein